MIPLSLTSSPLPFFPPHQYFTAYLTHPLLQIKHHLLPPPSLLPVTLYLTSPYFLFIYYSCPTRVTSSSLSLHLPGLPAVTNGCGRSLWCSCGRRPRNGAQCSGRSGWSRYPGFGSICGSRSTTHS